MTTEKLVRLSDVEYYLRQTARNMIDDIEKEDKELSNEEKAQVAGCVFAMRTLADHAHRIPTADAAEVVHARWVPVIGDAHMRILLGCTCYRCSACGRMEEENSEPYCHCGARMDAKEVPEDGKT